MVQRIAEAVIALVLLVPATTAFADVKSEEKTQMKFEGGLGRMMNLFGGKTTTGQIIDLKEEKVYELDVRDRTYTVMTFDEIRQRMEEARKKVAAEQKPSDAKEPQFDIDFDLKETGQKRNIGGFDAREIVPTATDADVAIPAGFTARR